MVALGGLAVLILSFNRLPGASTFLSDGTYWAFALLVLLGELLPTTIARNGSVEEITTSTTFSFALTISFGIGPAVLATVIASVIADGLRRKSPWKVLFNVGQYAISTAAAGGVYHWLLGGSSSISPGDLPAFLGAAATRFALNNALTGVGIGLARRVPILPYLRSDLGFQAASAGALLALAPIAVIAANRSIFFVPLLLLPIAGVHVAAKASLEKARFVARLEAVRQVSEAVNASLDLDRVLVAALGSTSEVTGLGEGQVWLVERDAMVLAASMNVPVNPKGALPAVAIRGSAIGSVLEAGRPAVIADPISPPRLTGISPDDAGPPSDRMAAVPLVIEGRPVGVFALGSLDGGGDGEEELDLLAALSRPIVAAVANARLHQELRRVDASRQLLLSRLVTAQEEERRRIASEIHDDSVQVMTAAHMRLQLIRKKIQDAGHLKGLQPLEETLRTAIARLRRLLFELRPAALEREGLAAAVRVYMEQTFSDTEIAYRVHTRLSEEPSLERRTLLYRIIQEALTNVRKHARARRVDVEIESEADGIVARVRDDGRGLPPGAEHQLEPGHLGLMGMRERAEVAGGWCRLDSAPGRGTSVTVWIPAEASGSSAA